VTSVTCLVLADLIS